MSADFGLCRFCVHGRVSMRGDALALWGECGTCRARGPVIDKSRADASRQAVAAYNATRELGRVAIVQPGKGLSSRAGAIGGWLQLQGQAVLAGEQGNPDACLLIYRAGQHAHVVLKGLGNADAQALLDAVTSSTRVRAAALPQPPKS